MSLIDQIDTGGGFVDSAVRFANGTGTPLLSAVDTGDGRAIADEYNLTFASVIAGTSANVTVASASPNNPYHHTKAVLLDGATTYKDVIPGATLVFSSSGSFANTWTASVKIGEYLGVFDSIGAGAGVPSSGVRHRVENDSADAVSAAKARLLPVVKWVKKVGTVFAIVRPFAEGATEKTQGGGDTSVSPYVLAVSATAGSGAGKTCTLTFDGGAFPAASIRNLSTGVDQNGTLIKATGTDFYRVVSGVLTGLEFAVSASAANGDTANVLIFSARFIQIAPDVSGSAGTYATTDVTLTESGQSAGVISPGGFAYFWRRVLVPNGADAESNPYPGDVCLQATATGGANWLI